MNPINDEMPSKDPSTDVQESEGNIKETKLEELSNDLKENEENVSEQLDQTEEAKIGENENIQDSKDNGNILEVSEKSSETINKETSESSVNEKSNREENVRKNEMKTETEMETETDLLLGTDAAEKTQIQETTEDKGAPMESESESENETEEFEDVEDVEIPGDEEVDEIIVPDEGEAEDLTDGKDNEEEIEKSINGDMEEEEEDEISLRYSEEEDNEIDSHLHEEETTKSSATAEKDDDDKKSLNNDNSSKDSEEADIDNLPAESEIVALEEEEDINNSEIPLEEPKSNELHNIDEDTDSRASYDPLNCTDNKDQDDEDTEVVKNVDCENSNESQCQEKEPDEEEEDAEVVKNVESENSNDSRSKEKEQDDEDKEVNDINQNVESENSAECQNEEKNSNEEDDEVQFVETRNSPICIESDEDDGNSKDTTNTSLSSTKNKNEDNKLIITTATTVVAVPKTVTVTRTSARKSTARFQQNRAPSNFNSPSNASQIQNKSKSFDYLLKAKTFNKRSFTGTSAQQIVDCIELLDSSDEESAPSRHKPAPTQQQKTPQKRTLLAAKGNYYKNNNNNKVTQTVPKRLPSNFTPYQIRQQPKKPAPPPLPPPTPQSNFLNAVQLQPAAVSGTNPPAFSALLSNKNVIIPNAFYGNPPNIRSTPDGELERRLVRWLENFINQFCKPQFEPTHSCFVFLQRALKYRDFVRIKALRGNMNSHVQSASNQLNIALMSELKTIFFKNKKVTSCGRRFCEFTCSAVPGKSVALMSHRISGKVTLKTCNMDLPKLTNSPSSSAASSSQPATTSVTRKRQLDEDEDEYTPDKPIFKTKPNRPPSENGDEDSGDTGDDRKRSLRTKRTKRIDNNFSYNEDDLLAEYEIEDEDDEKLAQVEIQRKIDQKRLEAQKQRQQQAKSFESAFIQAFAKSLDEPTTSSKTKNNASGQRIRLKNTTTATVTSIKQYTANNDAEDLLQATWIENVENDNTQVISDDDEPQEHRIYKQQQLQMEIQQQQQYYSLTKKINNKPQASPTTRLSARSSRRNQEEVITGDDDYDENNYYANNSNTLNIDPLYWPKNVDPQMYVNGKNKDRCVICSLNCQRLVHHYVNEHRGCETYNSRLSALQINKLKQVNCTASVSLYKNGQFLYESFCIFCQKNSRFMLRYWYQHYTMHTGEYAYRCTGCGIRKPTQSLLTQHHSQGCPQIGGGSGGIVQDYSYDPKSMQIEAKICTLCNYLQLHRSNIVKHLHTQHSVKQILPKHIQTVVLMKIPPNIPPLAPITPSPSYTSSVQNRHAYNRSSSSYAASSYIIEEEDNDVTYEEILPEETQPQPENHYYNYIPPYMQAAVNSGNFTFESVDAGDDLSFMICGMLDVEMNPDAN